MVPEHAPQENYNRVPEIQRFSKSAEISWSQDPSIFGAFFKKEILSPPLRTAYRTEPAGRFCKILPVVRIAVFGRQDESESTTPNQPHVLPGKRPHHCQTRETKIPKGF